jgi:hypothetical protein
MLIKATLQYSFIDRRSINTLLVHRCFFIEFMMRSLAPPSKAAIAIIASSIIVVAADSFPVAEPTFRFQPFNQLDSTSQNIAIEKLGYTQQTWNNHGLNPIERRRWTSLTSNERDAASQLGFTQPTWDCFINHYEQYTWDELDSAGAQTHYRNLGWTEDHWLMLDTAPTPETETLWWDMLNDNQKSAANGICYFKDNWNKIDMNPNPSFFPHPMPEFRYIPWSELSDSARTLASSAMNYTEDYWNNLGSSVVEQNTFFNLDADARDAAMELGFYTHTWDCFMNHYLSYYWGSFQDDLKVAIETLGWTEEMWSDNSNEYPPSEAKAWIDLTPEEKAAASRLCYFREIWDDEAITEWFDYTTGRQTAVKDDTHLPSGIDLSIFAETGYAGRDPGMVGAGAYTVDSGSSFRVMSTSVLAAVVGMCVLFV